MLLCKLVILLAKVQILQDSSSVPFMFLKSSYVHQVLSVCNFALTWTFPGDMGLHDTTDSCQNLVSHMFSQCISASVAGQVRVFVPFLGM